MNINLEFTKEDLQKALLSTTKAKKLVNDLISESAVQALHRKAEGATEAYLSDPTIEGKIERMIDNAMEKALDNLMAEYVNFRLKAAIHEKGKTFQLIVNKEGEK